MTKHKTDHLFTGHDATVALATMKLDEGALDKPEDGLSEEEKNTLEEWIAKYRSKYPVVARLA